MHIALLQLFHPATNPEANSFAAAIGGGETPQLNASINAEQLYALTVVLPSPPMSLRAGISVLKLGTQ